MLECVKSPLFVPLGVAPVKVSLSRWYISRSMVSERIDRQAHGILKVFSFLFLPFYILDSINPELLHRLKQIPRVHQSHSTPLCKIGPPIITFNSIVFNPSGAEICEDWLSTLTTSSCLLHLGLYNDIILLW